MEEYIAIHGEGSNIQEGLALSLEIITAAKNVQELTGSQGSDVAGPKVMQRVVPPKDAKWSLTISSVVAELANCRLKYDTC